VAALKRLVTLTGLARRASGGVCGPLLAAADASSGLLPKRAFDRCVRALVPADALALGPDDRQEFSVLLSSIFYNFEATEGATAGRAGSGAGECADGLELAVGMGVLCGGDKSGKLLHAWGLLDVDGDGLLTRAELVFFLRAFLRMLLALSFEASCQPTSHTRRVATDTSSYLAGTIARKYSERSGLVSFDGFAAWYQDGYHQMAPWLELLDLSKWVL
jgi:hypothetical protein